MNDQSVLFLRRVDCFLLCYKWRLTTTSANICSTCLSFLSSERTNLIRRQSGQVAHSHGGVALDKVRLAVQHFDQGGQAVQGDKGSFAVHVGRQVAERHRGKPNVETNLRRKNRALGLVRTRRGMYARIQSFCTSVSFMRTTPPLPRRFVTKQR